MKVNDDGIKALAINVIAKAVDDWKGFCSSMCKHCGKVQYLRDDSGKYFCTKCGKIARKQLQFTRETDKISFNELEKFFTGGTCDTYLTGTSLNADKIWAKLCKIRLKKLAKIKVAPLSQNKGLLCH